MTALMSPVAFPTLLALLAQGLAANLLQLQPHSRHADRDTAPFYKDLASKVDSISTAADFDAQEQEHHLPIAPLADHGAAMLKKWASVHDSSRPLINASDLGAELGGYALRLRDESRQKVAAQVHAMMHVATSGKPVAGDSEENSGYTAWSWLPSGVGQAMSASGNNLLKQWSAAHVSSSPQAQVKMAASGTDPLKKSLAAHVSSSPQTESKVVDIIAQDDSAGKHATHGSASSKLSKAFSHAHTLMHGFETEVPAEIDAVFHPSLQSGDGSQGSLLASGGDLLANWAKMHGESAAKASVRKELEKASTMVAPTSSAASIPTALPPSSIDAIHDDLQSLRSTMHEMQVDSSPRASNEADLHSAMRNIGTDVPNVPSLDANPLPVSDALKAAGVDALEQWSKAHSKAHSDVRKTRFMSPEPIPERTESLGSVTSPSPIHEADAAQESALGDIAKVQKWHASALHDAMRDIGSDSADHASGVSETHQLVDTQKAGANTLEHWSKAHEPKKASTFMKKEILLSPSSLPSAPEHIETSEQNVEPTDVERMQSSVSKWHESTLHDAMRGIGTDALDADSEALGVAIPAGPALKTLQAAGGDALDEWSKAHKKTAAPKPMFPAANVGASAMQAALNIHIEGGDPIDISARPHVDQEVSSLHTAPDDVSSRRPSMDNWHQSASHVAMRDIGSDVPDADLLNPNQGMPADTLKAAGAEALEHWTKAHAKPRTLKFMMPVEASSSTVPSAPLDGNRELAHPISQTAENWRTSAKRLHESGLHEAMHNIGGDVAEVDLSDMQPQIPTQVSAAAGADELADWSKAKQQAKKPKFMMPAEDLGTVHTVPHREQVEPEQVEDVHISSKQLHQSALHDAMRSIGSDAPDVDSKAPDALTTQTVLPSERGAGTKGEGLVENWSNAHSEKHKHKFLIDMYPPTPEPESNMVAVAMARGFGKKAALALEAPVAKAEKLHKVLQTMGDSPGMGDVMTRSQDPPSAVAASAGEDILKQWSRTHK